LGVRILFLDDAKLRHETFALAHGGDSITHVFTATEAVRALDELPRFDLVHLDHDLAEEHYLELSEGLRETPAPGDPPFDPGTGMDLVDHIIAMPAERRPGAVTVHTHNAVGEAMRARLDEARVPTSWVPF
jgi:CheY-like chemotaxis protein